MLPVCRQSSAEFQVNIVSSDTKQRCPEKNTDLREGAKHSARSVKQNNPLAHEAAVMNGVT